MRFQANYERPGSANMRWVITLTLFSLLGTSLACGQQVNISNRRDDGIDAIIRSLLLANLPKEYENAKKWGMTRPRWDGLMISFDGLRLDTKRRWKDVNHGTWTKYSAWLLNPDESLDVAISNMRKSPSGHAAFEVHVAARLGASGRMSEWNRGVQLISLNAEAEVDVAMRLDCEVSSRLDLSHFPPDVFLVPTVKSAQLAIRDFRLQRISDLHGPLVRQLGDSLRGDLEREINERSDKLVDKANVALKKKEDKLRLSLHDLTIGKWSILSPSSNSSELVQESDARPSP